MGVYISILQPCLISYYLCNSITKTTIHTDENAKPIFLAIASPPTGEVKDEADEAAGSSAVPTQWEFLIKKTDFNSYLTSASPGTSIAVSQVMGGGFPITDNIEGFKYDFPTQNLLLFACGSGIAPIRSAIESGQLNVSPAGSGGRTCTLYYGVRTPDDMPYVSKFSEWEAAGVQVVPVVSQPDLPCESGAVWQGRTGYVQNALEEDGVPIPRNSGALLCGVNGMVDAVTSMLGDAGGEFYSSLYSFHLCLVLTPFILIVSL